jgi:hypothetical protein
VPTLVGSSVLLDALTESPRGVPWLAGELADQGGREMLAINPIIHAEVSMGFALSRATAARPMTRGRGSELTFRLPAR